MAKTSAELALLQETDKSPSGFRIVWREIVRDKLALVSLIFLFTIIAAVYGISLFLDQKEIVTVDLFALYEKPSAVHWLGTDYGGRDVFGQLIIGTRNSMSIAFMVTFLRESLGF